jgi:hypothetical protein
VPARVRIDGAGAREARNGDRMEGGPPRRRQMQPGIAIAEVFAVPGTGYIGFTFRFDGRPPHYTLDTCLTLQDALASCDPHSERVWQEASDADETRILVSRSYKPGSVAERLLKSALDARYGEGPPRY